MQYALTDALGFGEVGSWLGVLQHQDDALEQAVIIRRGGLEVDVVECMRRQQHEVEDVAFGAHEALGLSRIGGRRRGYSGGVGHLRGK